MHQGHGLAEQFGRHHRTRIERRVFQRSDDAAPSSSLRTLRATRQPVRLSVDQRRRLEGLHPALRIEGQRQIDPAAVAALRLVEDRGAVAHRAARPLPVDKALFERRIAAVHVEIAVALPAQMRVIQRDLDPRAWRDRPPAMIDRLRSA